MTVMTGLTRRGFLECSLSALAARALGARDLPRDAGLLEVVPFVGEPNVPLDIPYGAGLEGRLNTDLSTLSADAAAIANERFFIRTRFPAGLAIPSAWQIRGERRAGRPEAWPLETLRGESEDCGLHAMDCAGNTRSRRFGLVSEARWQGVPVARLLQRLEASPGKARIRISGLDRRAPAGISARDASWIFTFDDLISTKAFLATGMNGKPLTTDRGAPVRLVVPGWYGATCVKWVDRMTVVPEAAATTPQMKEYASRTGQRGIPELARDYRAPTVEPAALPVRVEKWKREGHVAYRIIGLLWGDFRSSDALTVRFDPDPQRHPVAATPPGTAWALWTHEWKPSQPGTYRIELRTADAARARRLASGFYSRTVRIDEI